MLCEKCKQREATVRYTYTVNGSGVSYNLCGECYNKLSGSSHSLFGDWLFPMEKHHTEPKVMQVKKCDLCGYTFDQISAEGRVGCARCYKTFEKELAPVILRIHGNKTYTEEKETKDTESSLKKQLEKAIKEENYEEAAVLRDRIKALRGE